MTIVKAHGNIKFIFYQYVANISTRQ